MATASPAPRPATHTIEDLRRELNAGRSTVFELIRTGELPSIKIGRRRLVTEQALMEYLARLQSPSGAGGRRG